ncbi:MAG: hypothetical protein AM326_03145 [Candidatus Thorarchaeota archaeon SMTZ-45]|nr:MAG: hypothetical protein AM326_03145 [Candidatus Thorarchaeota archaeon SMTZ-45]
MKMRTLGRHHWALRKLADGKEHNHEIFRPVTAWSSKFLETLLIRGLVKRTHLNVMKPAKYVITELGQKALKKLDMEQSFEEITAEMAAVYFTGPNGRKEAFSAGYPFIAKRGFKWVEVEVKINEFWEEHFKHVTW